MCLLNSTQQIRVVGEHFEAYTDSGDFICSGDSFNKCSEELLNLIKAEIELLHSKGN